MTTEETKIASAASLLTTPALCLAIGILSFGNTWWTLGFSILFPVFLCKAEHRLVAFIGALFYHLAASRSLALSSVKFYGDDLLWGIFIWFLGNLIASSIYALLWHKNAWIRLMLIPLALVLTAVPPLGITGWANPLVSAGIIFPGSGIAGFFYVTALYASLVAGTMPITKIFFAISLWCLFTGKVPLDPDINAVSTKFHKTDDLGKDDFLRHQSMISLAGKTKGKIILYPENIISGGWTSASKFQWTKHGLGKTVVIGATQFTPNMSKNKSNVLVILGKSGENFYRQRQPVPFSMWRPLFDNSYEAHWFENPVIEIENKKIGFLVCYEGFLVWPVVHSYLSGAKHLAASSNFWWAHDDELPTIHSSIIKAWSRLFGLSYSIAVNA